MWSVEKVLQALPGVLPTALQNKYVIPTLFMRIRGSSWLDKLYRTYVVPMKGHNCTACPCIVSCVVSFSSASASISFLSLPFSLIVNFPCTISLCRNLTLCLKISGTVCHQQCALCNNGDRPIPYIPIAREQVGIYKPRYCSHKEHWSTPGII